MKYNQLHVYLQSAVEEIRQKLADADIGHMSLQINAIGRTTGISGIVIEYKLSEHYASEPKGHKLETVVEEFMRRHGWDKVNDPYLALPAPAKIDD